MKQLLTFFLTALLTFSVGWGAQVTFVAGTDKGSTTNTSSDSMAKEGITISSTSAGLAYAEYRFYNGTITISSTVGDISSVEFTCTSESYANVLSSSTLSIGSFTQSGTTVTWTGNASSFTIRNTAQTRASQIVVTTESGSTVEHNVYRKVTSPSDLVAGKKYIIVNEANNVGMGALNSSRYGTGVTGLEFTDDKVDIGGTDVVEFTLGGSSDAWTFKNGDYYLAQNNSNAYFMNSSSNTVVIAKWTIQSGSAGYAIKNNSSSNYIRYNTTSSVFGLYNITYYTDAVLYVQYDETEVFSIAEAYDYTGSQFTFARNAVVVYQSENDKYLYIKDDSGWGLVYDNAGTAFGTDFVNGNILNPGWQASKTVYNGLPEFNNPVASTFSSTTRGDAVEPVALTTFDANTELNMYAAMSNLTVTSVSTDGKTINLDGVSFVLRKQFDVSGLPNFEVGKTYNVRGFTGVYNGTYQFYPIWAEEVVTGDPTITLDPTSLTIDDSGANNSFTVEARYLHQNDNGNVSVAHNGVFNTTLTSSTNSIANWNGLQGFNRNDRSVDGTVTVTYNGRALTATDTYTVATEGASKTLTVTYVPSLYIYCDNGVTPWDFSANPAIAMTNNDDGTYTATLQDIPANSHILFGRASGLTYYWEGDGNRLFIGAVMDNGQDWQYGYNELPGLLDTDPSNPVKYRPIHFPEGGTYTITIDANAGTFNITKEVVLTGDFELVTDASQLAEGNEVIIVNTTVAGTARTMGQRNSNNYYGTDVTVTPSKTVTATDDTQIFTLESGSNGWYFKTSDDLYLTTSSSGTGNNLQTKAKDGNGDNTSLATIAIDEDDSNAEIHFQGNGNRKYLRYNVNNGGNSDIFSCYQYATSQAKVYIYQRTAQNASLSADKEHITLVTPAGADASEPQTFTVTGSNLTENVTLTVDNANFVLDPTSIVPVNGAVSQVVSVTYVGESAVNENATITITSSGKTVLVYVHGSKAAATLAEIESPNDLLNKKVTVSDELIGVWAVNNGATKLLWAKDQGQASIDKLPARTSDQDDYMVNRMKYQHYEFQGGYDWDESNWVVLDFANLDSSEDPENYVGHKLAAKSVVGTYVNAVNYTISLTQAPTMVSDEQDASDYPGYGEHDSNNYGTKYQWAFNTYIPANFMPQNLNREVDGVIVGATSGPNALENMQGQQLYFMNPKAMEVAHIWGVWSGNGKFTMYQVAMEDNQTINAWDLHGAVDVMGWGYNRVAQDMYGEPNNLAVQAHDFHALIVRKPTSNMFTATPSDDASSASYGIYPLDLPSGGHPTAVTEVSAGRTVKGVSYFNIMGMESSKPFQGVNIVVTRYTDGTTSTAKVIM